jgi:hypothetical protein
VPGEALLAALDFREGAGSMSGSRIGTTVLILLTSLIPKAVGLFRPEKARRSGGALGGGLDGIRLEVM